ncbi:pilus assembly protein FimT [Rhodanobacter sp. Soil772]|uniref:GspH/FimT family pseudopilin n=1 Tax=Rhodanobacter sp. Soil772 TaxID=1736406 RepID=UPI000701FAC8|nr:GspH/FimT family pseudopilin [Rhodanobacter sp. Soil772]KRE87542.1 pilus assembly protein FimT [Rhodanobacter sp. Soil772]
MQVLSRQRGVSLIEVRRPGNTGGRSPKCGSVRVAARRHERGFTLVELMITMAVALVLIMIAVPSFKSLTLSNKLNTAANDIINAIHVARMEAVKRNANAQLCSNSASVNTTTDDLGKACTTQTGAVYALAGATPSQVLTGTVGITGAVQLSGNVKAIRFGGQGLGQAVGVAGPYSGTVADICTSQMSTNNHRVITMTAGSILVSTSSSGACP